ncbi:hypothetical protein [Nannocystis pusilla]|uniref:hypothetical protein n=1 Tax=Nannocystis pusilla TaxID=889268 RepID=UPI003B7A3F9F
MSRLLELLEDLRTVGLHALASRLAPIAERLRAALTATDLLQILHDAVAALRELARDKSSPPPPPPAKRKGFWR